MKVFLCPNRTDLARLTATLLAEQISRKPNSVLGLATGRTMEAVYAHLVQRHREDGLDFSGCTTFNLDEYVGLPATDARSYHAYMHTHLFQHVGIAPSRTHLPNGMAADLAAEGQQYDAAIKAAGGIDLQLLGLGENGHIGFNEPLSSLVSRTRPVVLAPETRQQNAGLFDGNPESVPPLALTMGTGTILESRRIVLTVAGKAKAEMLRAVLEGPVTAQISASALHFHTNCLVLADEDAASALTIRPALDHALKHDPELCALHSLLT
ncbi:glucosamine-6-phosphate deaminase [Acetobacter tropicalis]|uniref:Glucosamine-6-phosphate deaminase n=1 Tax=Acetobacter tropicalis TaxID=104102 RepID=A0A095AZB4_9PROT|nr:glucosamine-6-phosphate deaminase [Acetobacter tropicalis]KAA8389075.1 glucosamine-6-phosphate deaminase [Acetobacter tropicalis]KAA8391805.1 glucosamine-6-phosphate deaminase [Acetobacter tropicalis]KGB22098.1 Glucosamine-6-phosphate deaminase [Acetobacter tropicalis]MBC9009072.1 glucosamine-6-phosphate deaminase [Acetobacter tropicalis]MDO8171250.1 glucosamine-6-phosphate deaminase [Acetobacter tropicalis]